MNGGRLLCAHRSNRQHSWHGSDRVRLGDDAILHSVDNECCLFLLRGVHRAYRVD